MATGCACYVRDGQEDEPEVIEEQFNLKICAVNNFKIKLNAPRRTVDDTDHHLYKIVPLHNIT